MRRLIVSLVVMLATASSIAAEIIPFSQEGELGVVLRGVRFPDNLGIDLNSGLTNRILIRMTLKESPGQARQRAAEIAVRYDLWEERFTMVTRLDGVALDTATLRTAQEVLAALSEIRLSRLFNTAALGSVTQLAITAELLLNPIDRERMENIRKWVAENSARAQLDPAGVLAARDASLANAVFNKIFEQYANGSDVAAAWQQRVSSTPFTLEGLNHERR